MRHRMLLGQMRKDERGVTAIEFAVLASAFFMLMFGAIEYGVFMLTKVAVEGAVQQAGREASIKPGTAGCDRVCIVKNYINSKTGGLINKQSVVMTATVVSNNTTGTPAIPDICLDDANDPHPVPPCVKWVENNGIPQYQQANAGSVGVGGELVEIRVTYLWKVLFPMFQSQFTSGGQVGVATITSSTVVKNEPF